MRITYIATFPPRECGIATFTKDLADATEKLKAKVTVVALNPKGVTLKYDRRVTFQLEQSKWRDYGAAAKFINGSRSDVVNLQHEYQIFGGMMGKYVLPFMERLRKPIVTTLHTIIPSPDPLRKHIIRGLGAYSEKVVTLTNLTARIIKEDYGLERDKVRVIPHGIHPFPRITSHQAKRKLGLDGKVVLSTFGFINTRKGIKYVIEALPQILKRNKDTIYLVIGRTHPKIVMKQGERHRRGLCRRVRTLGLEDKVKFHNRFLPLDELLLYLLATDIYIAPYTFEYQAVGGTLAYALGCGKAVVSTPFLFAKEVLADGRGLLANFKDSDSIARCVNRILSEDGLKESLEERAYRYSRRMLWSQVAKEYLKLYQEVIGG